LCHAPNYSGALPVFVAFGLALLLFKPDRITTVKWAAVALLILGLGFFAGIAVGRMKTINQPAIEASFALF
jgi:hypothetical protein